LTDNEGLARLHIPRRHLATTLARTFADMVHVHGFVHADPHPGNLLVRRSGEGETDYQLVVLDHGMYRRLTPQFRAGYCRLWQALVTRDHALGRRATLELGLEPAHYDALSLALTYRPAQGAGVLGGKMSKAEIEDLKRRYADVTARQVNAFMQRLPRDLLFVMRSTNMVRSLNLELGGTSRDRFRVTGESAIRGLLLTGEVHSVAPAAAVGRAAVGDDGMRRVALVSDVDVDVGIPPPGGADSGTTSNSSGTVALVGSLLSSLRRPPPTEPITYLNALSAGAVHSDPTESELVRQRRDTARKGAEASLVAGVADGVRSLAHDATLGWEIGKLRLLLWWVDTALWAATWWSGGEMGGGTLAAAGDKPYGHGTGDPG